jgi:hypothetical protein
MSTTLDQVVKVEVEVKKAVHQKTEVFLINNLAEENIMSG